MKRKGWVRLCCFVLSMCFFAGCKGNSESIALVLPDHFRLDNRKVYALGEATHGSKEFTALRLEVFKKLVQEQGVRVFVLEADFGECMEINSYIQLESEKSAQPSVKQLAFWVYQNAEMESIIEWMRSYNAATPNEKLHFLGFDSQQCSTSKTRLLNYLHTALPAQGTYYAEALKRISDSTILHMDQGELEHYLDLMGELSSGLHAHKAAFISIFSERDFALALELATSITQALTLAMKVPSENLIQLDELPNEERNAFLSSYQELENTRDAYMAARVEWIASFSNMYIADGSPIFITGHNLHILQDDNNEGKTTMGEHLHNAYQEDYYAIGTDFAKGSFLAMDTANGSLRLFTIGWDRPLAAYFASRDALSYLNFASERDDLFYSGQHMNTVGAIFSRAHEQSPENAMPVFFPAAAYDALFFFHEVHSFTLLH